MHTLLSTTALASDLVISGAQTPPVTTSNANAGPGNVITGGLGAALQKRFSSWSLDYDAESAGKYLGHTLTLTYRARF